MGRANSGDGIMAKKQNKTGIIGGKKPRSSGELYADIEGREYRAWKKINECMRIAEKLVKI